MPHRTRVTRKAVKTYGKHLMVDAYGADPARLGDVSFVFDTLCALVDLVGMHKIGFPHMAKFTAPEIAGVSGIVMIVESHISIHTYDRKRFFSMDLYSCKTFPHARVVWFLKERFGTKDMEVTVVRRGRRFPVD